MKTAYTIHPTDKKIVTINTYPWTSYVNKIPIYPTKNTFLLYTKNKSYTQAKWIEQLNLKDAWIEWLPNLDIFCSKSSIAYLQQEGYASGKYFPNTTNIAIKSPDYDMIMSQVMSTPQKWVFKSKAQRQEGIQIVDTRTMGPNDMNEWIETWRERNQTSYICIQPYIDNPILLEPNDKTLGNKTNIRIYAYLKISLDHITIGVGQNGFVYYGSNDNQYKNEITSGYIPRSFYNRYPLTHIEYFRYIQEQYGWTDDDITTIRQQLNMAVCEIILDLLTLSGQEKYWTTYGQYQWTPKFMNNTFFQLFGIDFQINRDKTFVCYELNKGPDMMMKGPRDGLLKLQTLYLYSKNVPQENEPLEWKMTMDEQLRECIHNGFSRQQIKDCHQEFLVYSFPKKTTIGY